MDINWFLSLALFALVMGVTPNSNNLIILSTATKGNNMETIKQILAVSIGFSLLLLLAIFGLAELITKASWVFLLAKFTGITFILFLAFELFFYKSKINYDKDSIKEYRFKDLLWLQLSNPKGWITAIAIAAAFLPSDANLFNYAFVSTAVFGVINLLVNSAWAVNALRIKTALSDPERL